MITKNYRWIDLFESGGIFSEQDLPFIIAELKEFRSYIATLKNPQMKEILERTNLLLSNLIEMEGKKVSFNIG